MDAKLDGVLERLGWMKKRSLLLPQTYVIIWLTGQSGAGKTKLSNALNIPAIRLDGDEMRDSISMDLGFSEQDRLKQNTRVARLANRLSYQSPVIISVIAPTERIRAVANGYCDAIWIYVKRTLPKMESYIYEEPTNYFTVDHDSLSISKSASIVERYIKEKSAIKVPNLESLSN